ncbi:MAG: acetate/propionate family kinase [Chlamydiae bacterium]|nr:acetate/propionate family kinase [Chlamydiota bacterium]
MNNLYKSWNELKGNQILAINCGSSSIKVSLFEYDKEVLHRFFDAHLKGINTDKSVLEITSSNGKEIVPSPIPLNVNEGLKFIFHTITDKFNFSFTSLMGIGHRFVHGGNQYCSSVYIDSQIISELEKLAGLAPLHNEACLAGIKECFNLEKSIPQIAIFDTAFHHSLPAVAATYAIPADICEKYQIKRYGFHGISHAFLWNTYKDYIGESFPNSKIITLHLGNGCSITAISGGISIDTSMGFTPAEGLIMSTRAGDIDAAVIEFICLHDKKTPSEVMEILNFHSGLVGISDISSNLETLLDLYHKNERAKLAVDMFCYRIVKYLGAYIAALGGAEAIIFSGGIGENSSIIREKIMSKMDWYGVKLDKKANQQAVGLYPGNIQKISASDSVVSLYVVATDENSFIAQEAYHLLKF